MENMALTAISPESLNNGFLFLASSPSCPEFPDDMTC